MEFRLTSIFDAQPFSAFYMNNSDHLLRWEPLRESGYHSVESWRDRLKEREKDQFEGRASYFVSYNGSNDIVAVCNLKILSGGLSRR